MKPSSIRRIMLWTGLPGLLFATSDFALHGLAIETLLCAQLVLGLMIWVALLDIRAFMRRLDDQPERRKNT